MTTQLLVRIAHPHVGRIETRVFTGSPVTIGRSRSNVLRLDHGDVPNRQGEIRFTSTLVEYVGADDAPGAIIGGVPVAARASVLLASDTLIQIGPYRLCADIEMLSDRSADPERADELAATDEFATGGIAPSKMFLATAARRTGGTDTLTSFVYRALKLADVVSAVVVKLRAGCGTAGQRPFDTSPLRSSWNAHEIADYLLDTDASENRLNELERYLVELAVRAQFPVSPDIGRA